MCIMTCHQVLKSVMSSIDFISLPTDSSIDPWTFTIDATKYDLWLQKVTFDRLQGLRIGQSFCNFFGITDFVLFYDDDFNRCQRYIRKQYLR